MENIPLDARIYVAGHMGLVGSAILRKLESERYTQLVTRTYKELDLMRQADVKPASATATGSIRFKGLDAAQRYQDRFEDAPQPALVIPANELMGQGLPVSLSAQEGSELIFFELIR